MKNRVTTGWTDDSAPEQTTLLILTPKTRTFFYNKQKDLLSEPNHIVT